MKLLLWVVVLSLRSPAGTCGSGECPGGRGQLAQELMRPLYIRRTPPENDQI